MGAQDGIVGEELTAEEEDLKPELVKWREAPVGKLDLLVNLDFRIFKFRILTVTFFLICRNKADVQRF